MYDIENTLLHEEEPLTINLSSEQCHILGTLATNEYDLGIRDYTPHSLKALQELINILYDKIHENGGHHDNA